jgi:hypothetical protein
MAEQKPRRLDRADVLGVLGVIIAILVVVLPVTWWLQCGLLAVAAVLISQLAFYSAAMIHRPKSQKLLVAAVTITGLVAISWSPVKSQYQKSQPPDVTPMLVSPEQPAVMLINESANVARNIKWGVVLWNLDSLDRVDPLPIPYQAFDFIRPREHGGPEQLFNAAILGLIKPGNRLFGYATVDCPDCATTRCVWIYIEYGKGGWYAPLPKEAPFVNTSQLFKMIPEIEKNVSSAMNMMAPAGRRIPIKKLD